MARDGWIADYNDPLTFLEIFKSDNGNNNCPWKNAEFDALIDQAKAEAVGGRDAWRPDLLLCGHLSQEAEPGRLLGFPAGL